MKNLLLLLSLSFVNIFSMQKKLTKVDLDQLEIRYLKLILERVAIGQTPIDSLNSDFEKLKLIINDELEVLVEQKMNQNHGVLRLFTVNGWGMQQDLSKNKIYPLNLAIINKNLEVIKFFLIKLKANPNLYDSQGNTSLIIALNCFPQAIQIMLNFHKYCSNCFAESCKPNCSGCHVAFYCDRNCQNQDWPKHKLECKNLQSNKVDVNLASKSDWLPLMIAAQINPGLLGQLLNNENIEINKKGLNEQTALISAIVNAEAIKLLLEKEKIDVNVKNRMGETALMLAIVKNITSAKTLLDHPNIDVNVKTNNGNTALTIAKKYQPDLIKKLEQMGAQ